MASEDMGLVQAQQRLDNGLNHPQLVFQDTFSCGPPPQRRPAVSSVPDPAAAKVTTRELTGGFIDHHQHHHYFHQPTTTDFHRAIFSSSAATAAAAAAATGDHPQRDSSHNWNTNSRASTTPSGEGSEDDDVDDDDDEDEDDDDNDDENEVGGLVAVDNDNNNHNNNNSNTVNCNDKTNSSNNNNSSDKIGNQKSKQLCSFGLKERNVVGQCGNDSNTSEMRNAVTIADADGDMYYSQYLQGTTEVGSNSGQKEMAIENGCGFSGRKDNVYSSESGESLRAILSDPLTGALMDDGMILPCGHSFGSDGIQHVLRMKACCTCSQAVSEDAVSPNLSLRAAVQAFRREEELQVNRASKRRRERYEQDKGAYGDSVLPDHPRGRGVQFPFAVTDRVIIKGNKRTPPRFVGREAIVTTQCLNGWYVVKTLDNAESVKLQYRSLAKVSDNQSPKPITTIPNWL